MRTFIVTIAVVAWASAGSAQPLDQVGYGEELDYSDLLEWYGLRFESADTTSGAWTLKARADQTEAQRRNLETWLAPSRP